MLPQDARELEHARALLAEDGAQLVVGDDLAFVLRVLQRVLLDVDPDLLRSS